MNLFGYTKTEACDYLLCKFEKNMKLEDYGTNTTFLICLEYFDIIDIVNLNYIKNRSGIFLINKSGDVLSFREFLDLLDD